jgi:hypothetical protein
LFDRPVDRPHDTPLEKKLLPISYLSLSPRKKKVRHSELTSSARVYRANLALPLRLLRQVSKDALCHGGPANIAQADKQY